MTAWFLDRVLPSFTAGAAVGVLGYLKLHFEKAWPYWGRKHEEPR